MLLKKLVKFSWPEAYLGPSRESIMHSFAKIVNGFYPLTISVKNFLHTSLTGLFCLRKNAGTDDFSSNS